ncbi:MAG: hypothetical protein ACI4IS_03520 [Acutalibacteraceae bacterium]
MKNNSFIRVHAFTVYEYLSKAVWLLIIPLIRTLLIKPQTIAQVIADYSLNILLTVAVVAGALYLYRTSLYRFDGDILTVKRRFMFKTSDTLFIKNNCFLLAGQSVLQRIFSAVKVTVISPACSVGREGVLCLSKRAYCEFERVFADAENEKRFLYEKRSSFLRILITCVFQSDFLTGIPIVSLILKRAGTLFGREYEQFLLGQIDISRYIFAVSIPPILGIVGGLLIFAWLSAVLVRVFRLSSFCVKGDGRNIFLSCGILQRLFFTAKKDSIYSVTVRQSIALLLMKTAAVYVNLPKNKAEKELLLLPAVRSKKALSCAERLTGFDTENCFCARPQNALFGYTALPFICILLSAVVNAYLHLVAVEILSVVFLIVCVVWLIFRIFAYKKAVLAIGGRTAVICFYKRLHITYSFIKKEYIEYVTIKQSLIQEFSGKCSLYLYTHRGCVLKIKHIRYSKALKAVKKLCDNPD